MEDVRPGDRVKNKGDNTPRKHARSLERLPDLAHRDFPPSSTTETDPLIPLLLIQAKANIF